MAAGANRRPFGMRVLGRVGRVDKGLAPGVVGAGGQTGRILGAGPPTSKAMSGLRTGVIAR
jgi:hypothetical protein